MPGNMVDLIFLCNVHFFNLCPPLSICQSKDTTFCLSYQSPKKIMVTDNTSHRDLEENRVGRLHQWSQKHLYKMLPSPGLRWDPVWHRLPALDHSWTVWAHILWKSWGWRAQLHAYGWQEKWQFYDQPRSVLLREGIHQESSARDLLETWNPEIHGTGEYPILGYHG